MIEMIVADKQVVDIFKHRRVDRQLAAATHKRNVAEHGIEHEPLAAELHKKRIVPQPHQRIAFYIFEGVEVVHPGIPFFAALLLALGIE